MEAFWEPTRPYLIGRMDTVIRFELDFHEEKILSVRQPPFKQWGVIEYFTPLEMTLQSFFKCQDEIVNI